MLLHKSTNFENFISNEEILDKYYVKIITKAFIV